VRHACVPPSLTTKKKKKKERKPRVRQQACEYSRLASDDLAVRPSSVADVETRPAAETAHCSSGAGHSALPLRCAGPASRVLYRIRRMFVVVGTSVRARMASRDSAARAIGSRMGRRRASRARPLPVDLATSIDSSLRSYRCRAAAKTLCVSSVSAKIETNSVATAGAPLTARLRRRWRRRPLDATCSSSLRWRSRSHGGTRSKWATRLTQARSSRHAGIGATACKTKKGRSLHLTQARERLLRQTIPCGARRGASSAGARLLTGM